MVPFGIVNSEEKHNTLSW